MPDQADLACEAEAVLRKRRGAGMIDVEVTDQAGARRVLMVRFPRAKTAIGTGVTTLIVFGLPWLLLPFYDAGVVVAAVLVLALLFGWFLVSLAITAVRGGFLALTQTGVLFQTGLSSVLIPWTAISGTSADIDGTKARSPVLRLSLRGDCKVPGWPWPAALHPVFFGSSRRKLRILAWWFQPVPLDRMVAIVRYLAGHPEERPRICSTDPGRRVQSDDPGQGRKSHRACAGPDLDWTPGSLEYPRLSTLTSRCRPLPTAMGPPSGASIPAGSQPRTALGSVRR